MLPLLPQAEQVGAAGEGPAIQWGCMLRQGPALCSGVSSQLHNDSRPAALFKVVSLVLVSETAVSEQRLERVCCRYSISSLQPLRKGLTCSRSCSSSCCRASPWRLRVWNGCRRPGMGLLPGTGLLIRLATDFGRTVALSTCSWRSCCSMLSFVLLCWAGMLSQGASACCSTAGQRQLGTAAALGCCLAQGARARCSTAGEGQLLGSALLHQASRACCSTAGEGHLGSIASVWQEMRQREPMHIAAQHPG